ncbi:MAG: ATP-dependent helicase, partial [Mycoplasma sp.]
MDLSGLNRNQKNAVSADNCSVLVIAGAGSGKTRVLTMRYAYLIDHFNIDPEKILAITFTNKAANEMKSRLEKSLGKLNYNWIGTFHSICLKILRQDIDKLGRSRDFSIIDDDDQIQIFRDAYKKNGIMVKDIPYQQIFYLLDKCKNEKFEINDFLNENNWKYLHIKNKGEAIDKSYIVDFYQKFCLSNNLLDFNDLLILTNKLFDNEEVKNKWANMFDSILVDEFQDTNDEQYKLIKALSSIKHSIFAVGDPDQTIYTWRGAKPELLHNFPKIFKDT